MKVSLQLTTQVCEFSNCARHRKIRKESEAAQNTPKEKPSRAPSASRNTSAGEVNNVRGFGIYVVLRHERSRNRRRRFLYCQPIPSTDQRQSRTGLLGCL